MSLLLALKSRYKELTGEDLGGGADKKKGKGKPEESKGKMADKGKTEKKKKVESAGDGGEGPSVKHKTRYIPPRLTPLTRPHDSLL